MANFKRRKPRRRVRCSLCTPHRHGNAKMDKPRQQLRAEVINKELAE